MDFPRGGGSAITPLEYRELSEEVDQKVKSDINQNKKRKSTSNKKSNAKKKQIEVTKEKIADVNNKSKEFLKYKQLSIGMKVFGVVKQILPDELIVGLPNNLSGHVCKADIGKEFISESFDDESELSDFFQINQAVCCVIKDLTELNSRKKITLSIDPSQALGDIDEFSVGFNFFGIIASEEEHGYIVTLPNKNGFLPKASLNGNVSLKEGQYVHVKVISILDRVITLNLSGFNETTEAEAILEYSMILPGSLLKGKITHIGESNVQVKVEPFYEGFVNFNHISNVKNYKTGQKVLVRTLYVDTAAKRIGFSLSPHLVEFSNSNEYSQMIGKLVKTKVVRIDQGLGISVEFNQSKGFSHISQLSDENIELIDNEFQCGSEHEGRIIDFDMCDGFYLLSFKPSVVRHDYIMLSDLKCGMMQKGTVVSVDENGAVVLLNNHIKAFCHVNHLGTLRMSKPEMRYKVGESYKFQVLAMDLSIKKISLTAKKALIQMTYPRISDWNDLSTDIISSGVVIAIKPVGLILSFYNNITGLLPIKEILDINSYSLGQVVTVRVAHFESNQHRLILSLNLQGNPSKILEVGSTISGSVAYKKEDYLVIEIEKTFHKLPLLQLSDHAAIAKQKFDRLNVGDQIENMLVLNRLNKDECLLTCKKSLVLLHGEKKLPSSVKEVTEGRSFIGYIKNITDFGVFVGFLGGFSGLVKKSELTDTHYSSVTLSNLKLHQTVIVFVHSIANEKISLTMKKTVLEELNAFDSTFYFKTILSDITNQAIAVGKEVRCIKKQETNTGFIVEIQNQKDYTGVIMNKEIEKADFKCIVLEVNYETKIVDLAKKEATKGLQSDEAKIVLIKDEYLICLSKEKVVYVYFRSFNDMVNPFLTFSNGQIIKISGLKPFDKHRFIAKYTSLPTTEKPNSASYNINDVVDIKITEIKEYQMNAVILKDSSKARIHYSQVLDEYAGSPPFAKFKKGDTMKAKIIGYHDAKTYKSLDISHRHNKRTIFDLSIQKREIESTELHYGDRLSYHQYSVGMKVRGIVYQTDNSGVSMFLSTHARAHLDALELSGKSFSVGEILEVYVAFKNISNETIDVCLTSPQPLTIGSVIQGRITKSHPLSFTVYLGQGRNARLYITDISKTALFPMNTLKKGQTVNVELVSQNEARIDVAIERDESNEKIEVGSIMNGYIKQIQGGLFVILDRNGTTGRVKIAEISDSFIADWQALFKLNQRVKVIVTSIDNGHIELSMKESKTCPESVLSYSSLSVGETVSCSVKKVEEYGVFLSIHNSNISGLCHKSKIPPLLRPMLNVGFKLTAEIIKLEDGKVSFSLENSEEIMEVEDEIVQDAPIEENEGANEDSNVDDNEPKVALPVQGSLFSWSDDKENVEMDEAESETEETSEKKKTARKEQEFDPENEPQSPEDFERLILGSPNSSYIWIKYMAYYLKMSEIQKARTIGERALKTINFRDEQEKMNVWVACLNLENSFGSDDSLQSVFEKAVQYNDSKTMHLQLAKIYEASSKMDKAVELYEKIMKKFSQSCKAFLNAAIFYLNDRKLEDFRNILQRSLKSLPKRKHIKIISKFAVLEFKQGDAERGRTIFEGVLSHNPKRLDLWNIYLDMEIKVGKLNIIRRLFERILSNKFSTKKMKFLFKKYLDFEIKSGDDKGVEHVKELATQYVESLE